MNNKFKNFLFELQNLNPSLNLMTAKKNGKFDRSSNFFADCDFSKLILPEGYSCSSNGEIFFEGSTDAIFYAHNFSQNSDKDFFEDMPRTKDDDFFDSIEEQNKIVNSEVLSNEIRNILNCINVNVVKANIANLNLLKLESKKEVSKLFSLTSSMFYNDDNEYVKVPEFKSSSIKKGLNRAVSKTRTSEEKFALNNLITSSMAELLDMNLGYSINEMVPTLTLSEKVKVDGVTYKANVPLTIEEYKKALGYDDYVNIVKSFSKQNQDDDTKAYVAKIKKEIKKINTSISDYNKALAKSQSPIEQANFLFNKLSVDAHEYIDEFSKNPDMLKTLKNGTFSSKTMYKKYKTIIAYCILESNFRQKEESLSYEPSSMRDVFTNYERISNEMSYTKAYLNKIKIFFENKNNLLYNHGVVNLKEDSQKLIDDFYSSIQDLKQEYQMSDTSSKSTTERSNLESNHTNLDFDQITPKSTQVNSESEKTAPKSTQVNLESEKFVPKSTQVNLESEKAATKIENTNLESEHIKSNEEYHSLRDEIIEDDPFSKADRISGNKKKYECKYVKKAPKGLIGKLYSNKVVELIRNTVNKFLEGSYTTQYKFAVKDVELAKQTSLNYLTYLKSSEKNFHSVEQRVTRLENYKNVDAQFKQISAMCSKTVDGYAQQIAEIRANKNGDEAVVTEQDKLKARIIINKAVEQKVGLERKLETEKLLMIKDGFDVEHLDDCIENENVSLQEASEMYAKRQHDYEEKKQIVIDKEERFEKLKVKIAKKGFEVSEKLESSVFDFANPVNLKKTKKSEEPKKTEEPMKSEEPKKTEEPNRSEEPMKSEESKKTEEIKKLEEISRPKKIDRSVNPSSSSDGFEIKFGLNEDQKNVGDGSIASRKANLESLLAKLKAMNPDAITDDLANQIYGKPNDVEFSSTGGKRI